MSTAPAPIQSAPAPAPTPVQSATPEGQQIQQFASKVRAKYPGAYDDLKDADLAKRIVTKHPEYADMLPKAFAAPPTQFEQERTPTIDTSGGMLGRTVSGIGRGLNNLVEGAYQTVAHPLDTANNIASSTEQHIKQGMQEPSTMGKMAEFGAAVPMLGPLGKQLGERAGAGDVAGAISEGLTTAAAPSVLKEGIGRVSDAIPRTERAGKAFQSVKAAAGGNTVAVTNELSDATTRMKELGDRGHVLPKVANRFYNRVTDPNAPPLTFNEARDFYSKAGELSGDEQSRMSPTMRRSLNQFRTQLGKTIEDTAGQAGKLSEYKGAMGEYRNAMKMKQIGKTAVEGAVKYLPYAGGALAAKSLIQGK